MKKLVLALATTGLCSSVFAALPGSDDPTLINIPQYQGGFFVGAVGLYQQPSVSGEALDYAIVNTANVPIFSTPLHLNYEKVEPGYDWGWGVNVGYLFPQTGNDIEVKYWQLDTKDTASYTTGSEQSVAAHFFEFIEFNAGKATAELDTQQVDAVVGQWINVGCRLRLHPQTGIQYTNIDEELNGTYQDPRGNGNITQAKNTSDYDGVGPELGFDGSYYLGAGFGLVGHFNSALLIGDLDPSLSAHEFFGGASPITVHYSPLGGSETHVVPNLDGKLGADYTFLFNNASESSLTFEIGYEVNHYFNAIDTISADAFNTNIGSNIIRHQTSDLSIDGPYASLTLQI